MSRPRFLRPRAALSHVLALAVAVAGPAAPALAHSVAPLRLSGITENADALPDLRVSSLQVSPSTASPGQQISLSFVVYNLGTATAPPVSVSAIHFPNTVSAATLRDLGVIATTPTLAPNYGVKMTRTVTVPVGAVAAPGYIGTLADSGDAVVESDETNNGSGVEFTVSSVTPPPPPPATPTPTTESALLEQQVLARINEVRAQNGLAALATNSRIMDAARRHSDDMAGRNVLSHTGSDGSTMGQRMTEAGYLWRSAGEIIASGYTTASSVVTGWMNSPGHRAIILTAGYREFGAGVARSASGRLYWTVDFGSPR